MDHVFAAIGGSGSRFLIQTLSSRFSVGDKPDTVFRALLPEARVDDVKIDDRSFEERSGGFQLKPLESIDQSIGRYVEFLRSDPRRTAVFNTCAELGVFSRLGIKKVVFLVRHPLHAYGSWCKPERHGDVIRKLGGSSDLRAISHYARRWVAFTDEIFRLEKLGIPGTVIRYEFAAEDADKEPELAWIFENFDSSRRNAGILGKSSEIQFLEMVRRNSDRLYGRRSV